MELRRANGTTFIPSATDGKAFITAWENDQPEDYNKLKEEWRAYLEAIGEIPARKRQTRVEETPHAEEMAEPGDGPPKPSSWMERILRR
jgi:hypothetical protein